jgi:hypothetical protein
MSCENFEVGYKCFAREPLVVSKRILNIPFWFHTIPAGATGVVIRKWANRHELQVYWDMYGPRVLSHTQIHKLQSWFHGQLMPNR